MADKIKLEGFKELHAALGELAEATQKNVVRRALKGFGDLLAEDAKSKAPVKSGRLRDGIIVTTRKPKGMDVGKQAYGKAMRAGLGKQAARAALVSARQEAKSYAAVYIGVSSDVKMRGIFQEFGTANHSAQPYMRPAWDANRQGILDGLRDAIAGEIGKAKARAARKAARQLAKAGG